jgi:hypothetical protein
LVTTEGFSKENIPRGWREISRWLRLTACHRLISSHPPHGMAYLRQLKLIALLSERTE